MTDSAEPQSSAARRFGLRLVVVALLVALDLWSKSAVFAWLAEQPAGMVLDRHHHLRYPIVGEWLTFFRSWNPGMAWGFDGLPSWLLVGGRVAAVGFLAWILARTPATRRVLGWSLTLILAGALGNLHDNLFLEPRDAALRFGEVRDFIDVYFDGIGKRGWHFPTFNVADACISVGAVLLFVSSFFPDPEPDSGAEQSDGPESSEAPGEAVEAGERAG